MQEEYIGTADISGRTSVSTCSDSAKGNFLKLFLLLVGFLCFSLSSSAFQKKDSIKRIEIKIILKEKPKQGINYDSLFHAEHKPVVSTSDSADKIPAASNKSIEKTITTHSGNDAETASSDIVEFKKEIDTQIASIQQKVLNGKAKKAVKSTSRSSIKDSIAADRIAIIQIGFLIFIVGLFFGLRLNKVAFSISALGAILIVVALYI